MTMSSLISHGRFFDDIHFPHGFARSGDFTRSQAELLEQHGRHLKALHEGSVQPASDEEVHFVAVCMGEAEATTTLEKTWKSYLNALNKRNVFFSASASGSVSNSEDSDYDDD
jgi:uncharacterized protein YifE (UPF0438 family)